MVALQLMHWLSFYLFLIGCWTTNNINFVGLILYFFQHHIINIINGTVRLFY